MGAVEDPSQAHLWAVLQLRAEQHLVNGGGTVSIMIMTTETIKSMAPTKVIASGMMPNTAIWPT